MFSGNVVLDFFQIREGHIYIYIYIYIRLFSTLFVPVICLIHNIWPEHDRPVLYPFYMSLNLSGILHYFSSYRRIKSPTIGTNTVIRRQLIHTSNVLFPFQARLQLCGASIKIAPSVFPFFGTHETTRGPLNVFSHFIVTSITKICQFILILVKMGHR
jgi:hypothetical protein